MSDLQTANVPTSNSAADAKNANIIYILYLVAFVVGITALIGVIMAYVNRQGAPEWVQSHYRYQIRTFWIGLLYGTIGVITSFVVIGFAVLLFLAVWYIVRCVKGMQQLHGSTPVANPATWLW